MTVFVKAIKEQLLAAIKKIKETSLAADTIIPGRNIPFAEIQRDRLVILENIIGTYAPQKDDQVNFDNLKKHLQDACNELDKEHKKHSESPGDTICSLQKLITRLNSLNSILESFTHDIRGIENNFMLFNQEDNEEPLNMLCYYAIQYLAYKTLDPQARATALSKSLSQSVLKYVAPDKASHVISFKKEHCLLTHLKDCFTFYPFTGSQQAKKIAVLTTIKLILSTNQEICGNPGGFRMNWGFFTSIEIPYPSVASLGKLQEYMLDAKQAVESLSTQEQTPTPSP